MPAGALIPAGQVWGGKPCTFVRELSESELMENYQRSYAKGAVQFDSENLWPKYEEGELGAGEVSLEDYNESKYFAAFKK